MQNEPELTTYIGYIYMDNFELVNDLEHDENYKWVVVKEFQDLMRKALNADAEHFAVAFYKAKVATKNIIDSYTQHFQGLVEFAKKEPETVKKMYINLYADDGGDLKQQEMQIAEFFAKSNELLNKYFPESYRYKQNSHSVSAYLFLYAPDYHYMYKATQAGIFADCIEFYDDWGSGDNIKLEPFYRMCDELVSAIKNNKALLAINESRYDGRFRTKFEEMFEDKEKHLLAFDIIYCSSVYGLYEGMSFSRPKTKEKQLYFERKKKAAQLLEQYNEAVRQQELLDVAVDYIKTELKPGTEIKHRFFGRGVVKSLEENRLTISFEEMGEEKQFGLLMIIANQIIYVGDEFQKNVQQYISVLKKASTISSGISRAKSALEPYTEYLD